jgi:hypothetical protein
MASLQSLNGFKSSSRRDAGTSDRDVRATGVGADFTRSLAGVSLTRPVPLGGFSDGFA